MTSDHECTRSKRIQLVSSFDVTSYDCTEYHVNIYSVTVVGVRRSSQLMMTTNHHSEKETEYYQSMRSYVIFLSSHIFHRRCRPFV